MIAIIDYGAGNLFSVHNALTYLGLPHEITRDPARIQKADGLILPGVGAFPDAMGMLRETGLLPVIRAEAVTKPFLGICLGMQLLFERGTEFQETEGLGLLPGSVDRISTPYKIPHMGWNHLRKNGDSPLLKNVPDGSSVYFVHSYYAQGCGAALAATTDYGIPITAAVEQDNLFGCQFHPEKSGPAGLRILSSFGRLTERKMVCDSLSCH